MEIPVFCSHSEMVGIDTIVPNPRNPNHHPDRQLELLAKIIRTQGWRNPIVISKRSGFATKGHGRLEAAKLLGLAHVPVDFQECDNRITELAEADNDALRDIIAELDGQIAKIGSLAFATAWRRGNPTGKVVLLTPHYDVLEWLEPDWVIDTKTASFERRSLRRPKCELEIIKTDSRYWPLFKPHYYLNLPLPPAAEYFVGLVDGEPACHLAVGPFFTAPGYRATRLVTMPEWQGAGVGTRFLNWVAQYHLEGHGRCNRKLPTYFHTSHPQLVQALRRSPLWVQTEVGGAVRRQQGQMQKEHRQVAPPAGCCGQGQGAHRHQRLRLRRTLPRGARIQVHRPTEMNIFLTGQKSFGRAVFKALLEDGHNIVGVAPPPPEKYYDKLHGIALRYHVPIVCEAKYLTSEHIPDNTDLIISAHSHWYVSDRAVEKARLGGIGFHPSLLPRHRGRDAVRRTIACGDPVTGGTIYWLDKVVDGGPVQLQRHLFVDRRWDHHELWKHLFPLGVQMVRDAVAMLARGEIVREEQNPAYATWEPPYDATARLYRPELFQLPPSMDDEP